MVVEALDASPCMEIGLLFLLLRGPSVFGMRDARGAIGKEKSGLGSISMRGAPCSNESAPIEPKSLPCRWWRLAVATSAILRANGAK